MRCCCGRACSGAEGGEVGAVPTDRLENRPPVAQRALHHRTHGAPGALHRRRARAGSRRLHIWASLAEQERKMISDRTRAGLAAARARGRKLGQPARSKAHQRRVSNAWQCGDKKVRPGARRGVPSARGMGAAAAGHTWKTNLAPLSCRGAQRSKHRVTGGGRWAGEQLKRLGNRLGLRHPPAGKRKTFVQRPHHRQRWVLG